MKFMNRIESDNLSRLTARLHIQTLQTTHDQPCELDQLANSNSPEEPQKYREGDNYNIKDNKQSIILQKNHQNTKEK